MNKPFLPAWILSVFLLAFVFLPALADDPSPPPPAGPSPDPTSASSLSVTPPMERPAWQQHLTLGPGDVLNFALYIDDAPALIRQNVVIAPDGRVNYLEARDVVAAGLTIDELRQKIDEELVKSRNYAAPHSMITPVAINSKKYFVLGSVVGKGVYTLDRPLTVIEAIGRGGGLETGVFERNTVELADLSHSFLARRGQHVPIDFEKLFQQGDLSQNVALEPDDYLYFASSGANEVYVLGEVQLPGPVPYGPATSVIGAITTRGSFTPAAYKARVLIVRGSLSHPETFVVDTKDILDGKTLNFRLKSRDIVYVAQRPWQRAADLINNGIQAYIQAVVVTYTGAKIGPFGSPYIH